MNDVLPHYVATRLGDRPDAYLVEGGRMTPLSLTEAPLSSTAPPHMLDGLAGMTEVMETIARVERVHASVCFGGVVVGALVPGLDEAILEMRRREAERLKVSAA